jgi:hypothetical protein
MRTLITSLGSLCLVGLLALPSQAADTYAPSKLFLMKDPGSEEAKKIVWKIKDKDYLGGEVSIVGDPVTNGATLRVTLLVSTHCSQPPCDEGGGDQCFDLPASGWSPISSLGFKYKDKGLANGPVQLASVKRTPSGVFFVKAKLKGPGIDLYLEDELGFYGAILALGGGDAYGSGSGGATPKPNDSRTFRVRNEDGTASYPPPCSPSGAFLD